MKIIFLSKFYPRCLRNEYFNNSKSGLAAAADAHQYALACGFNKICPDFEIVNLPALFPYPTRYRRLFERSVDLHENGMTIHNVGFNNLVFFQQWSRYLQTKKYLTRITDRSSESIWLVVYSTSLYSLKAATEIKKRYGCVKLCMIVPDIPDDIRNHSLIGKISEKINQIGFASFDSYCKDFDSFVLLTKYMTEKMPAAFKSFIVSEGIYEESDSQRVINYVDNGSFIILYSGTLDKKFGVMNLVNAIHGIADNNIRLQLFGTGDAEKEIESLAQIDTRIEFKGTVSRDEVIQRQSEASLLVNPRIPDENPFTRYSFPSKTMEYLASGVPVLLYELDGIPEEYYDYCYHLDKKNSSVESLREEILRITNIPYQDRKQLAERARGFILEQKSSAKVCERIYSYLNSNK